jgi:DNA-binding transcriptional ArsR family regulator
MAYAPATQAAEILSTLSETSRLCVLAELARCGSNGASLTDLTAALGLPAKVVGASVARLVAVGIVVRVGNSYCAQLGEMRELVGRLDATNPINDLLEEYPRLKGVFSHGRLVSTPELSVHGRDLAELVARLVQLTGPADEAEVNRRLAVVSDDVALLRRPCVDEGVWQRDRSGTTYLPAPAALASPSSDD